MSQTTEQQIKTELIQLRREYRRRLRLAFDGLNPETRPTPSQESILKDKDTQAFWILGSNRCLAEGTLVATPTGPVQIQSIKAGDWVYSEKGTPIQVLETFRQGKQPVRDYSQYGKIWATCTDNHIWLTESKRGKFEERTLVDLPKGTSVCRVEVAAPLGSKSVPYAYALGALLGDGCSRDDRKHAVYISSATDEIPNKVAQQLNSIATKCSESNYTWKIPQVAFPPEYIAWCSKRYAHEKLVDLADVSTWDRNSVLGLLAGILDTDGSVFVQPDGVVLQVGMQAKSVIDFVEWAFLALWQIPVTRNIDARPKYKNGPVYTASLKHRAFVERALKELSPHIQLERKRWNAEWKDAWHSKPHKIGLVPSKEYREVECYDIHVKSDTNLYLLANGLVTHNSGKTQTGGRIVSWWFNEDHPYMARPKEWGRGPLQILVVGRLGEQIESEIWEKKIKPFLNAGDIQVVKVGNSLQRVVNKKNGNRIIFMSHHDAVNAREKVQAFTANVVWLDEMPDDSGLVSELLMRILSSQGRLYATFTPLIRNEEIRKIVDSGAVGHRKCLLLMLDNPIYRGREAEVEAQVRAACASEAEYRARMFGEWYAGESRVTWYDALRHKAEPEGYDKAWRHIAVADPSASGLTGLSVWGENPRTGVWYNVLAKTLKGAAAYDLLDVIESEIAGYNITKRWTDCNPAGFYKEAARRGKPWQAYSDKNDRKLDTIDKFNAALLNGRVKLTRHSAELEDDLVRATWAVGNPGKIVNASSLHLFDTARYFVDIMPDHDPKVHQVLTPTQEIRQQWKSRKTKEHEIKEYQIRQRKSRWKRSQVQSLSFLR